MAVVVSKGAYIQPDGTRFIPPGFEADSEKVDAAVRASVLAAIPDHYGDACEAVRYLIGGDGKRLRPMLTVGAARACGSSVDDVIPVAAAVDMLHHAMLLHDDVIDVASVRRGRPSANVVWSNKISVLSGDVLFSLACRTLDRHLPDGVGLAAQAALEIVRGELRQAHDARKVERCADRFIEAAKEKTGLMTSFACVAGSMASEVRPVNRGARCRLALDAFGQDFGIAYQLADDACDYGARWDGYKKLPGQDFRAGIVTMPAVLAWQRGTPDERSFITTALATGNVGAGDFERAVAVMQRTDAIADTVAEAKQYGERARSHLEEFGNAAADGLAWLVDRYISDVEA